MRRSRGFTLIEILISLAIGLVIFGAAAASTTIFIKNRNLDATKEMAISYLRTAVMRAAHSEGNLTHGVSFSGGKITLFRGISYAARQAGYDVVWTPPSYMTMTGVTEVVFSKQTGTPSVAGDISISNALRAVVITVYPTGAISEP